MFPITITLHNHEQFSAVNAALLALAARKEPEPEAKKPKAISAKTEATPAPTQPTAEVTAVAAPEPKVETSEPAPAAKVEYADLQKAVLALHKADPTAAKPIAEAMGFPNFKAMPEDKWAEALERVQAALAKIGG